METRVEEFRRMELELVRAWFKPKMRVLELGGGSGYQARLISSWECEVISLDIPNSPRWPKTYFNVQNYDGLHIPFSADSFDIVFSSNMLEHVPKDNLPLLLSEIRRVMRKPSGVGIQILPTSAWRGWNIGAHYIYLVKYVLGYGETAAMPTIPARDEALRKYGLRDLIKRAAIPGPHGEYSSAFSELYYFSQRRWVKEFKKTGLITTQVARLGAFYTGYGLVHKISLQNRIRLSHLFGSATCAYILKAA